MLCWIRVLKIKRAVVSYSAGIKALNLVFNPTWKQSVLISAKTAEWLVSSQQVVNCQLSKLLLFPFMVSLRGEAHVETGSESLSWQEHEIGTCFFFLFSSVLEPVCTLACGTSCTTRLMQCHKFSWCSNREKMGFFYVSCLQNAWWNQTYCSPGSSLQCWMWSVTILFCVFVSGCSAIFLMNELYIWKRDGPNSIFFLSADNFPSWIGRHWVSVLFCYVYIKLSLF